MCRRNLTAPICIAILAVLMGNVPVPAATCNFYNTTGDNLWSTGANWSCGIPPTASDSFMHRYPLWGGKNTDILIPPDYNDAVCWQAVVGQDQEGLCVLNVEGSLSVLGGDLFAVGYIGTGSGRVNVRPGGSITITTTDKNAIGLHGRGVLHMTGGELTLTQRGLWVGFGPTGVGHIQMDGGVLDACGWLQWRDGTGTIDLAGGTIMIDGKKEPYFTTDNPQWGRPLDYITAWGGAGKVLIEYDGTHTFLRAAAMGPGQAMKPSHAGIMDVLDAEGEPLGWKPGSLADKHNVYFGTDPNALTLISENQDPNQYTLVPPQVPLQLGTDYFWRIDEVNAPSSPGIIVGEVWSFTTEDFVRADNMESYSGATTPIYKIWKDGFGWTTPAPGDHGNGTGAMVDANSATVHGGLQSMKFVYDNTGTTTNAFGEAISAYYSEAEVDTADLDVGHDWTGHSVTTLDLWFRGTAGNDTGETMYIALEDGDGGLATVKYGDKGEAASNLASTSWRVWRIDMPNEFTGVNLANIKKVYIGFGVRGNAATPPAGSGTGVVYFDDIALYGHRCFHPPGAADINGDCVVDFKDLAIIGDSWLISGISALP